MGRLHLVGSPAVLSVALAALLACGSDTPPQPPPVKHLYFSQDRNGNGLFELDMATGAATLVGAGNTATTAATIGLTETADKAVLLGSTWSDIAVIAADGSSATAISGSVGVEALAMNVTTGVLYGAINGSFFTVDPVTGLLAANLASPPADVEGLAADPTKNLVYGIARFDTGLFVYNVAANQWSLVGDTGINWLDPGLAYDHLAGNLYGVDNNTDSLYRINPSTAATVLVGPLGTQGGGGLAFVVE